MGGWCCGTGSITIDWTVDKSGYVPGEDIIVNGAIQNESKESVAVSKVALNMVREVNFAQVLSFSSQIFFHKIYLDDELTLRRSYLFFSLPLHHITTNTRINIC